MGEAERGLKKKTCSSESGKPGCRRMKDTVGVWVQQKEEERLRVERVRVTREGLRGAGKGVHRRQVKRVKAARVDKKAAGTADHARERWRRRT